MNREGHAWEALLSRAASAFTSPSSALFVELLSAWVCTTGRRTICGMVAVMGPEARRAHDAYHRLYGQGSGKTDPQGRTTTTGYNNMGQVTSVSYSDGDPSESRSYYTSGPETGLLESTTGASGTTAYTYDLDGRTTSITAPGGTLSYLYNDDGQLSQLTYPNGKAVTYGYTLGDETSMTDWLGNTTTFGYDQAGRLATTALPNGVAEPTTYDNDSQVSFMGADEGTTTLASFDYTRNDDEETTEEQYTGTPGPSSTSYGFDPVKRLSSAGSSSYSYDDASELTGGPGGTTQTFDAAGQLCWAEVDPPTGSTCSSPPSGATTYTYDQEGEQTGSTDATGTTTYGWDQAGELTSATTPSGTTSYSYDTQGLLASRTAGGQDADFVWDPVEDPTAPLLVDDGTNYYMYGPDDPPVEQISVATGTPSYYVHDALGSTRLLTSPSGAVERSWSYDAWGKPTSASGSSPATVSPVGPLLTATGTTISVSPQATGDLMVLMVDTNNSTPPEVTSVSGGGVGTWSLAQRLTDSSGGGYDTEIWTGVVDETGPSTISTTVGVYRGPGRRCDYLQKLSDGVRGSRDRGPVPTSHNCRGPQRDP